MARWAERAEAARADHPHERIAYGPGPREVLDLFTPEGQPEAPVAVFLHGGYWQALDGAAFRGIAPALLSHGVAVALPTYDLAPAVSLGRILRQVRTATDLIRARTGTRPLVFGHSAGGHMAAALLSEGRAGAAVAISGVFDLAPLLETSLNAALQLDPLMATALSPIHWPAPDGSSPGGTTLDCWVGAEESAEFRRQSHAMAGRWGAGGADTSVRELVGLNHFTVLDPLFDADSPEVARLVELAREASGETHREAAPA
ncbi:MAG: alpha/beta hydrolase [Brevundimonas sp.]|uniref:alpha/beta hydrolase n=1 Tax=Brevundimonas sp. TaxID=1871086 RepID=UPI0030028266